MPSLEVRALTRSCSWFGFGDLTVLYSARLPQQG